MLASAADEHDAGPFRSSYGTVGVGRGGRAVAARL